MIQIEDRMRGERVLATLKKCQPLVVILVFVTSVAISTEKNVIETNNYMTSSPYFSLSASIFYQPPTPLDKRLSFDG